MPSANTRESCTRNRKIGLPYVPPFDPVLRSHANWDLEGSGGGPGPRFGELVESGAVDRGLPSVQPDLGMDDAVELTSTQCRTCARCSWTRGEGSNPSPPRGAPSWGLKLFGIFGAATQGVPPSYPLSHPISFLPPIPPPSLPFPPSIVDCTRLHAPADGPPCSVCPQGGGRASCAP